MHHKIKGSETRSYAYGLLAACVCSLFTPVAVIFGCAIALILLSLFMDG